MSSPLLLGFIIDVSNRTRLDLVRIALVELIEKKLFPDDKAYYYQKDKIEVPNRATEIVASILTSRSRDLEPDALEQTVYVLGREVTDNYCRCIFTLSDRYQLRNRFNYNKSIRLDCRDGFNSKFVFCDFSDKPIDLQIDSPNFLYLHFPDVKSFGVKIINYVKELGK